MPETHHRGSAAGEGNLISGNSWYGIAIFGQGSYDNKMLGNKIGTNLSGSAGLENQQSGILLFGAPRNTIGGTTAGSGNLISGTIYMVSESRTRRQVRMCCTAT